MPYCIQPDLPNSDVRFWASYTQPQESRGVRIPRHSRQAKELRCTK